MKLALARLAGCVMSIGMGIHAAGTDGITTSPQASPQALILTAAPQDREVFATWSPLAGADYVLRWKRTSASTWNAIAAGAATSRAVPALTNDVAHDFLVEARVGGALVAISTTIRATPRARPDCVALEYYPWPPPVSLFCTKAALDDYLVTRNIAPLTLKCRQRAVTAWTIDTPDCLYTTPQGEHLLLLRSADTMFAGANQYPKPADVRRYARQAIWGEVDPFAGAAPVTRTVLPETLIGHVTRHIHAQSFRIAYQGGLSSRITWFVPAAPVSGRYAIYHEGHGGAAVTIGADTIDWLLQRGWHVIAVDMPLLGANTADARPGLQTHGDFASLDGAVSPLQYFLAPVQAVVDWILEADPFRDPDLLMIGRSGGGLTTYLYAAVDPRIDIAVSIAGGRPISERLDAPWGAAELGDYEQTIPHFYNVVAHEHLMLAAGSKGAFYVFNRWDACCFRVDQDGAFVDYLRGAATAIGKPVGVFVDPNNPAHSIGAQGYAELEVYLNQILNRVPRIPTPPTGMRIVR
jgi:dienelactone hydrolase